MNSRLKIAAVIVVASAAAFASSLRGEPSRRSGYRATTEARLARGAL